MIDWIEVIVPITHKQVFDGGLVQSIDDNGVLEWAKIKQLPVEGSHSSNIRTKSEGTNSKGQSTHLFISGNPLKFLQGHNLFGMDDPVALATTMVVFVCQKINIHYTVFDVHRWFRGDFHFKRLDLTYMYTVGNEERVSAFMRGLADTAKMQYRGRGEFTGDTLYFGKHSRSWALKIYPKYKEITSRKKAHRLPDSIREEHRQRLHEYAHGTVRLELVLRSMHLKRIGLDYGKWWVCDPTKSIFRSHLEGLTMPENVKLPEQTVDDLPRALHSTYTLWKDGHDVRQLMTKPTFYRHRKMLLEYDIDISVPCANPDKKSNVVPIRTVITAEPLGVPDWARGTDLFYEVK